ncbi:MAG: serine protease [Pseudomonadota bacterium]
MKHLNHYCLLLSLTFFAGVMSGTAFAEKGASNKIINGSEAMPGEWPWMASLQDNDGHFCGGALIDPYWIITAAHCVDNSRLGLPVLGSNDFFVLVGLHQRSMPDGAEKISVQQVFQHPDWDRFNFDSLNDIALIQLSTPAKHQTIITFMPDMPTLVPTQSAIALGWGQTSLHPFSFSDILLKVTLPIVEQAVCQQVYQDEYNISDTQICAGFEQGEFDTCTGDSGGPLMIFDGEDWRQIGITSFGGHLDGPACAGEQAYGIYTRVSAFAGFIAQTINPELVFEGLQPIYEVDDTLTIDLTERLPKARGNVDLWVALGVGESLLFVSGPAEAPQFTADARPWKVGISETELQHRILNVPLPLGLEGQYIVYAVYTKNNGEMDLEHILGSLRSNIAVAEFEIQ